MSGPRMRAAVLAAPRRIELELVPRPEPGPGQVRVRLEGSGVCGSNLVPWQGREWFRYPFAPGAPGHEGWGRVDALGPGARGLAEGERVALLSGAAFAEYDVAPVERVVRIPDAIPGPFPGEALGCGVNVFRRSGIRAGDRVAVVGAGFLGLVALRLAVLAGAQVVALSRRETARRRALEQGAVEAIPWDAAQGIARRAEGQPDEAAPQRAGGSGGGEPRLSRRAPPRSIDPYDVVVEAVGSQAALDVASALVREGGRLVVAGFHQDGRRTVDLGSWNWRGIDVVNAHERDPRVVREGVRLAAAAVAERRLDPAALYATFPLDRLDAAFRAMEERPGGFVKALATP